MDGFHSTVLQRPPHFDEDGSNGAPSSGEDRGPRGGLRDILNPGSAASQAPPMPAHGPPGASAPPRPPSASFNLRSPTQTDFHHPHPPSFPSASSSVNGANHQAPAPRPILNNPFMPASTAATSLPPPSLAAPSAVSPSSGSSGATSGLQASTQSPLHAPSVFYPQDVRSDRESTREKPAAGSFYDPTKDTAKDRKVSDSNGSWQNTSQVSTPKVSEIAPKKNNF